MALKKSEIYSTLLKCANKLRSNSGIGAESFKNYVLILLFIKYVSDRVKSGESTIIEIPEGCTFDDIVACKDKKNIGDKINKVIGQIAQKNDLQDIISVTDHDFCDRKLGTVDEATKLISELVAAFQTDGLDFSKNRAADDDLIGDAYEYLMRNFASQAGKDKGQFYTPTEVSRLMALLIGIDKDTRPGVASVYDPTCGSGSLLLRVRAAAKRKVSIDGQDIDPANIELSYMNMVLHGCDTADIRVGDTLNSPKHTTGGKLQTYDYIVSNPKFSLHNWMNGAKENDEYGRWNTNVGVPPQQYGDYAFLLHCVKCLKREGKCAIILPNGVLTRGGEEAKLRKWLIEQRLITGIIAFPANAFFGTSIAGNVIVLDNSRTKDGIFFIDASNLGYKDEDSKIRLREQDIKRVIDAWYARKDITHFAHLATYETKQKKDEDRPMYEIERNGFSLNFSLYVTPEDKEIHHSIEAHLYGGIPKVDIERLNKYWVICPTLPDVLFRQYSAKRADHYSLAVPQDNISTTIEKNASFRKQVATYEKTIQEWKKETEPLMLAVDKDNDPKSLIALWGQQMLDKFRKCPSLVDEYDVYDQLMKYYAKTLQDDLFMISRDGWVVSLVIPTKRTVKYTDLQCDLLPVPIVVSHFHHVLKKKIDDNEAELAIMQSQKESLDGEIDAEEDEAHKASLKKELSIVEKKIKSKKAEIKKLDKELYEALVETYTNLSPEVVRSIIVKEKWLAEISEQVICAMDEVTRSIATEVSALHYRYEHTLSELQQAYSKKEDAVRQHLADMGFSL